MRIGVYGGSFNPPHLGHFAAARAAAQALELDRLLLLPANHPPHKVLPEGAASPQARLEMTRIMADALLLPGVAEASDLEIARGGASYTADTLERLRELYPEAEFWLLMGSDMFLTLHQWVGPERILALAGICAFGRTEADETQRLLPQKQYLEARFGARVRLLRVDDPVEISSSRLRALLPEGRGGEFLLPAVYGYILTKRLYGTRAELKHLDIPELRACSYAMVQQKRVRHIRGTEEEAVRLARHYGADETAARRAGILHDCTKYWTLEEHLALCDKYGVALDALERTAIKLLHAKTGACIAKYVFGETDAVYDAIFWHTTGKADMSPLAKILYMADYIEPNRDFEGVEELRALAYRDLDRAILTGVEMTIADMEERGYQIHTNTLQARQWLLEHGVKREA